MQNTTNLNQTLHTKDTVQFICNLKNLTQAGHVKPADLVAKLQEKLSDLQHHLHILMEVLETKQADNRMQHTTNLNQTLYAKDSDTAQLINNLKRFIQAGHMKPADLVAKLQEKLLDLQHHLHILNEVLKTD